VVLVYSGQVDWSQFSVKDEKAIGGIIFGFRKLEGLWQLVWISQVPPYAMENSNNDYSCQGKGEISRVVYKKSDFNRHDFYDILLWIKLSLLSGDFSTFEELFAETLTISSYEDNYYPISIVEFLSLLRTRLEGFPHADHYAVIGNKIYIFTSGWTPLWEINKICPSGCNKFSLPAHTGTITFVLTLIKGNWYFQTITYGEVPDWWITKYNVQLISFDTIQFGTTQIASIQDVGIRVPDQKVLTSNPLCSKVNPTRLQIDGFAFISFYPFLSNRVRKDAGISNKIIGSLPPGTAVKILEGPKCADQWVWWRVKAVNSSLTGWTAEGDKEAYWLIPCESKKNCGTR
jgi:hypothetical protein